MVDGRNASRGARFLLSLALLVSCAPRTETEKVAPPPIDLSTPDRTVESLWRYQDWRARTAYEWGQTREDQTKTAFAPEAAAEIAKDSAAFAATLGFRSNNSVTKVEVESESRAIVLVREFDYGGEKEPTNRQYLLAKSEAGWVIRDKTKVCWRCEGSGLEADMASHLERLNTTGRSHGVDQMQCSICRGKGWISEIYD